MILSTIYSSFWQCSIVFHQAFQTKQMHLTEINMNCAATEPVNILILMSSPMESSQNDLQGPFNTTSAGCNQCNNKRQYKIKQLERKWQNNKKAIKIKSDQEKIKRRKQTNMLMPYLNRAETFTLMLDCWAWLSSDRGHGDPPLTARNKKAF